MTNGFILNSETINFPDKNKGLFNRIKEQDGNNFANQDEAGFLQKTKSTYDRLKTNAKSKVFDFLFGEEIEQPKNEIGQDNIIRSGINNGGRTGGVVSFVGDISKGFKENISTPFQPTNLMPKENKGFGYRVGELFGTGARMLDNPLVRGVAAYGLSKYNGDYNPLEQGLTAMSTNIASKNKDSLYRKQLNQLGIDTSNTTGFIGDETYKNIALNNYRNRNLQIKGDLGILKDNTSRAKLIFQGLKEGSISPEEAQTLISQYGINANDLQISNDTRQTNSNIILNDKRGEALITNAKANETRADSQKQVNDYILSTEAQEPTNTTFSTTGGIIKEGTIIRNPQTGERKVLRGGEWQKI